MATRKPSRSEWQLKSGKWTRSLGSRGACVRLFQKRSGGLFYRAFWVPSRGVDRKCLGTADRVEVERLGKALLGALLKGDETESSRALPLGTLGYYYRTRSVVYQGLSERARKEHDARMKILVAFFGKECDVRSLTQEDQIAFVRKRLAGRLFLGMSDKGKERLTAPVRQRSAQADIEVLRAIFRWATTYRVGEGLRLLEETLSAEEPTVSLAAASERTGYSADHLDRLIKSGRLTDYGRKHPPRVKVLECPRKVSLASADGQRYNADTDARSLVGSRRIRGIRNAS
jgi:hypothetical protein